METVRLYDDKFNEEVPALYLEDNHLEVIDKYPNKKAQKVLALSLMGVGLMLTAGSLLSKILNKK